MNVMKQSRIRQHKERPYFFIRIILPTFLSFCLFTVSIFTVIIPSFEQNIVERKREMIRELTNTAYSIIEEYYAKECEGTLPRQSAQNECAERIKNMRYGEGGKDYFWITDMQPVMVMHPYRPELNGADLNNYRDPAGKRLFAVFVDTVRASSHGYVDYMWQWKDDASRIVPKLSYVREFKPWGWIIGTGIYIEDLKDEVHKLTTHLVYISFGILGVLAALLFFITHQSLGIERKKRQAEEGLVESEARFRSLVEASTEGLVMYLEGEFVYANTMMLTMLGVGTDSMEHGELRNLLCGTDTRTSSGMLYFRSIVDGSYTAVPQVAELVTTAGKPLSVLLTASPIALGEKNGVTIIVRDIGSQSEDKDAFSAGRYDFLTEAFHIGVFRGTAGKKCVLLEMNPVCATLLGFTASQDAIGTPFADLFSNTNDWETFLHTMAEQGKAMNHIAVVHRQDGKAITLAISAVSSLDDSSGSLYWDGIIEDVTERMKAGEEREALIAELQASLHFLQEPVSHYIRDIISCPMNTSVRKAAALMTRMKYSAVLVTSEGGEYIGIVTDRDIRNRVVAAGMDIENPVFEVMTAPLVVIRDNTLIFDAFLAMHERAVRHLAIADAENNIISVISSEELLQVQRHASSFLLREISVAASVNEVASIQQRLPFIVRALVESGAKSRNVSKIITSVSDAVLRRLSEFAIDDLGKPPVPFAFLALGSQGREEQTLYTDQDNAIVYQDVPENSRQAVARYFSKFADIVCRGMDHCGYHFCPGDSMAMNPKWCQSLSTWKQYYTSWIHQSDPQDLLTLSIFFDFRCVYGDDSFSTELRRHLFATAENQSGFFLHLTKNSLLHKPPVGLLGNIQLESKGEHAETFNIKNTLIPISDFARLYAIKFAVAATNTIERYQQLRLKGVLQESTYQELLLAYNYLMQMRLRHQTSLQQKHIPLDNAVRPSELTQIEIKTLKNTFSQIASIQKALSYDFTGEAL